MGALAFFRSRRAGEGQNGDGSDENGCGSCHARPREQEACPTGRSCSSSSLVLAIPSISTRPPKPRIRPATALGPALRRDTTPGEPASFCRMPPTHRRHANGRRQSPHCLTCAFLPPCPRPKAPRDSLATGQRPPRPARGRHRVPGRRRPGPQDARLGARGSSPRRQRRPRSRPGSMGKPAEAGTEGRDREDEAQEMAPA